MTVLERHQRAPGWVWRRWGGSVLVMGPDRVPHQLDGAASVVWRHLDQPATAEEIVASSSPWPEVPEDPLVLVVEAIGELATRGMVSSGERPPSGP